MTIEAFSSDNLPPPVGPFSPAVRSGGFIFFSGLVGTDPATGKLVDGGVEAEARQLFRNLAILLDAVGKSFADVVRAGVFLTDIGDFATINAVYAEAFDAPFPARTTVGVAALPLGASIEIDVVVEA
jgi:2-iminobutanoate/2-iminopropanoate deaminase